MNLVLGVVNTGLFKGLKLASARVAAFAAKMKAVGMSITMAFTMPFALIVGAGVKMAMDFEKSMTKVQTLVLGSGEEMEKYAHHVVEISKLTAQGAHETADGLYFLTSAGLRGANALETLTTVSKGVAIGLGESGDLARVAAAAQNAYGVEVITASEAIDKFGMAVRTGMFESKELAESLGTQVGMAAELGISFDQLLANISTYTKVTGDARSATTGFGGVMMAMAKETTKGRKALVGIGTTYAEIRAEVKEKGLAQTLFRMKDAFKEQGIEMTQFFGKAQAVKNLFGTLGKQGDTYLEILDEMGESANFTAEAFDVLAETPAFKIEKSINNIKISFEKIGSIAMPVIAKILGGIGNLIGKFDKLSGATKNLVLTIGGIIALAGPLLSFFGFLGSVLAFIISPIGLVIAGLAILGVAIYKNWDTVKKWIAAIMNYFIRLYNESMVFRGAIQLLIMNFKNLWESCKFAFLTIWTIVKMTAKNLMAVLGGIGKMLLGVFTLSWSDVKEGFTDILGGMKGNFTEALDEIGKNAKAGGKKFAENITDAVNKTLRSEKIEFVTADDIQGGVDGMMDWAKDGVAKVKEFFGGSEAELDFSDMLGEPQPLPDPPRGGGGGGDGDGDGGGGGGDGTTEALSKQKSAIRTHLEGMGGMWTGYFAKQDGEWAAWGEKTQAITAQVVEVVGGAITQMDAIGAQKHKNEMMALDNEYNAELAYLESMGMDDEKFQAKKAELDKKFSEKKKRLEIKEAKRAKKIALMQAIISTAAAIAQALPVIPLAVLAGVMGAAQVAAIAGQPIPMAKGGLAYSPTMAIVGDNPNAANDPEVIAPLSKLKGMFSGGALDLGVRGVLRGDNIVLVSDKTSTSRRRFV